jgi:hypothetical protein
MSQTGSIAISTNLGDSANKSEAGMSDLNPKIESAI